MFIKCIQFKAITLFILKRFSISNILFFYFFNHIPLWNLICSLISWVNCNNKLGFNFILLILHFFFFCFFFFNFSYFSLFFSCYYESKSTRLNCYFLVVIRVFWMYLIKLVKSSYVFVKYLKLKVFWFNFCFNFSCSVL